MSTPQDPRDSGRTPEDGTENSPDPRGRASGGRSSDTPDEPIIDPSSPQPPDDNQTSGHVAQPPDESAAVGTPQPPASTDPGPTEWARPGGSGDPPTEYLPKLLHRDSGGATDSGARPPGPGSPADDQPTQRMPEEAESAGSGEGPQPDKGSTAFTHGWQPGTAQPGGDVPPQAWTPRPEEQAPGQAWQPQHPGYPRASSPPPGPYGGRPGQPGAPSGWGAAPGGQSGWGEGPGTGTGDPYSGQPGGGAAPGGQFGQGGAPGQQGWSGEQHAGGAVPGGSGSPGGPAHWGAAPGGDPAWGHGGQPGWGGGRPSAGDYPAYPQHQQYQPYGADQQPGRSGPQVLSIIGFVCAAVSLFFCPILFGPAGIVLGIIGHVRGEPLGKWAAIAAAACLVLGALLGILITGTDIVPEG